MDADDLVRRRVGLGVERGIGQEPDLGGRHLLQFTVVAAVHVVLPDGEIALLRQRVRDREALLQIGDFLFTFGNKWRDATNGATHLLH
jgi:hypothetical protein